MPSESRESSVPPIESKSPSKSVYKPPERRPEEVFSELPRPLKDLPNMLKELWFSPEATKSLINWIIEKTNVIMKSGNYPQDVKDRLMRYVMEKSEDLGEFKKENIKSWAAGVYTSSVGTLPDPDKDMSYYYGKLAESRVKDIGNVVAGLQVAYGPKIKIGKEEYTSATLDALRKWVKGLDDKYSLNLSTDFLGSYVDAWGKNTWSNLAMGNLRLSLSWAVLDQVEKKLWEKLNSRQFMLNLANSWTLRAESFPKWSRDSLVATVLESYLREFQMFQWRESSIRNIRGTADGKNDFLTAWSSLVEDHPFGEKREMGDMKFWEIMLIITQATQALPLVGSAAGVAYDSAELYTWLSMDGSKANKAVASLGVLWGTVGVVSLGSVPLDKLIKGKRIAEVVGKLWAAIEALPRALEKALQIEKVDPTILVKIVKWMEKIWAGLEQNGIPVNSALSQIRWLIQKWSKPAERTTVAEWRVRDSAWAKNLGKAIEWDAAAEWISENAARIKRIQADFPELKNLSGKDFDKLIAIHKINQWWETVGKYSIRSLGEKMKLLREMKIPEETAKKLIKWGYLGDVAEDVTDTRAILDMVNKKWLDISDFLERKGWKIGQGEISAIMHERPDMQSPEELSRFLKSLDWVTLPGDISGMFRKGQEFVKSTKISALMANPKAMKSEDLPSLILGQDGQIEQVWLLQTFLKDGPPSEIAKFISDFALNPKDGKNFLEICSDKNIVELMIKRTTDRTELGKLLIALTDRPPANISKDIVDTLLTGIELGKQKWSFVWDKADKIVLSLKLVTEKKDSTIQLDAFLKWGWNWEELDALLRKDGPLKTVWNRKIGALIDGKDWGNLREMLRKWQAEYFSDIAIMRIPDYIYNHFPKLDKIGQKELASLFDKWGRFEKFTERWSDRTKSILFPARYGK